MKDYISLDLTGEVIDNPQKKGKNIVFTVINKTGKYTTSFLTIVKNYERPIDINKGDKVFIGKAGFWADGGLNKLAVTESGHIEVVRKRCNYGEMEV